jgi:putative phage-type endonuclease
MTFKIIECQQGSTEWLALRKTKITATDTGVIMGFNPWKTPLMLWEEKLGIREPQAVNDKMKEGSRLECEARDLLNSFSETQESHFLPQVLISIQHPFMMASLDAINDLGEIVEIKCGKGSHELALKKEVPSYYMAQLQKQMYVANTQSCYYFSYRSDDDNIGFDVYRDDDFIEKMIEAETAFYKCLMDFTPPPATDRDFVKRDDGEWNETVKNWKDCKRRIQCEEDLEAVLRADLIKMCDGQSSQGCGVKISKTISKGRISYADIPELKNIDIEKYRGKPIISYRFTETKDQDG